MSDATCPESDCAAPPRLKVADTIKDDANLQEAFRAYLAGETQAEAARRFGFSNATFGRRLRAAGIPIRGRAEVIRSRTDMADEALMAELGEAVQRYEDGEPALWLAKEYGVGYRRFITMLARMGVQQRTVRENLAIMYARMTPEERRQVASAAHAAKRGRPANLMSMERRAQTLERTLQLSSRYDLLLGLWLAQRGLQFVPQKAIGKYNADIALSDLPVVVEVNGPGHGSDGERWAERCRWLLGEGWHIIEVEVDGPISALRESAADKIVALVDDVRRNEADWGRHVVIDGYGEPVTIPGECGVA